MIQWLKEVLLVLTSESLIAAGERSLSYGELLRYVGMWILMATYGAGFSRDSFWESNEYNE